MRATRKTIVIALVILIILAGCGSPATKTAPHTAPQLTVSPEVTAEVEFGKPFSDAADYMEGAGMFDAQEALKHIEYLAGDELEGRLVGTPGNLKAGDYIAARFAEYGLLPAGSEGSYFQPFNTAVTLNVKQPVLTVFHPVTEVPGDGERSRTFVTHDDYMPRTGIYIGSGDTTSQVVWLGGCDPSDLNAGLANKIILCEPPPGASSGKTIEKALEYKVGGLLVLWPENGPYTRSGYGMGNLIDMPAFRISHKVAEEILSGSQYTLEDLDDLEVPTTFATTVHMAASFEFTLTKARNVLGLLPGTDPQHKNEIVVVGAHYDHVGKDPDGTIFNGANDNASGVAVMLEIARLWQAQGFHPSRSVLFAAWDAEEEGLYGSQEYVSGIGKSTNQVVAMINLEMAGIGDTVFIGGESAMADQLKASASAFGFAMDVDAAGGSDDISFQDAGIPAACSSINPDTFLETRLHRPEDDIHFIDLDSLKLVGVFTAHALAAWCGGGLVPTTQD